MTGPAARRARPAAPRSTPRRGCGAPAGKRYFFPGFWLVYLGQAVNGVAHHSHGPAAVVGYVIVVLFAACYLVALPIGWGGRGRAFWALAAFAFVLTAVEASFAGKDALTFCVYLAVLHRRVARPLGHAAGRRADGRGRGLLPRCRPGHGAGRSTGTPR